MNKKHSFHSALHFWQLLSVLSDNQAVRSQPSSEVTDTTCLEIKAATKTLYHTAPAEPAKTLYRNYGKSCILPNFSDSTIVRLFAAENTLLL